MIAKEKPSIIHTIHIITASFMANWFEWDVISTKEK